MIQCRHKAVVGRHPSGAPAADFEGAISSSKLGVLYNEERFFDEIGELYDSYYEFDTYDQETPRVEAL